jgi:aspartyl/asparaginyl beta-hydroxylase (cupin superfamily)
MLVFLAVSGAIAWAAAAFLFVVALSWRPPARLRRWLEAPARFPYAICFRYRAAGLLWAGLRRLGVRVPAPEVVSACRSVTLRETRELRDAMREVDGLPTVEKGKAALQLRSVFEIPSRRVHRIPSPFTDPLQYPPHFLPGVPARTFYDPAEFEWVRPLEEAFPVIRAELLRVLEEDGMGFQAYLSEGEQRLAGWNTFNFWFYGRKFEENCARCPRTTEVLEALPRFEKDHIMFSALNPHAHIPPHTGPMNGIIRGHLALLAPEGCYIRVGRDERTWREGEVLVFDDSFEHEVWNHSERLRVVLFMNFWHPCLAGEEVAVLERFRRAYEQGPLSRVHAENQARVRGHDLARPA